jgi:hypothetical protein
LFLLQLYDTGAYNSSLKSSVPVWKMCGICHPGTGLIHYAYIISGQMRISQWEVLEHLPVHFQLHFSCSRA